MSKVEIDGKTFLVKGPDLCHPDDGFFEVIGVAREFEHDGKPYRCAIELRRDTRDMTAEQAATAAKPLLDEWEHMVVHGESE